MADQRKWGMILPATIASDPLLLRSMFARAAAENQCEMVDEPEVVPLESVDPQWSEELAIMYNEPEMARCTCWFRPLQPAAAEAGA